MYKLLDLFRYMCTKHVYLEKLNINGKEIIRYLIFFRTGKYPVICTNGVVSFIILFASMQTLNRRFNIS